MPSENNYNHDLFERWQLVQGFPMADRRTFTEAFGIEPFVPLSGERDWMKNGKVWNNQVGGNQNCFYAFFVRFLPKGKATTFAAWCEEHDLWFVVDGLSYVDDMVMIVVMPYATEFEYQ